MLGSWVCWRLLLGWVLLLGQTVSGDSDATEEPPLDESEVPGPESQEPKETFPESQEPEEQDSESEKPVREAEEEQTSDEKLESNERVERKYLQGDLSSPWNYAINDVKEAVLKHHLQHSNEFYKPYENANLMGQKAIGTMIQLRIPVVRTNCTNDQKPKAEESDHSYYYRLYHADRYPRNCEPLSDSEEQDCRFTLFEDARNPGEPIIIAYQCHFFHEKWGRGMDFPPEGLLEDM